MSLDEIRRQIDNLDRELINLISRRLSLALKTSSLKDEIIDQVRENLILSRIDTYDLEGIDPDVINRIFQKILEESRSLQLRNK